MLARIFGLKYRAKGWNFKNSDYKKVCEKHEMCTKVVTKMYKG